MHGKRGVVLLEVLVALTVVTVGGLAALEAVTTGLRTERDMAGREQEMERASRVLARYAVLDRPALEQRIGAQVLDGFEVSVQRPSETVFRLALVATAAPGQEMLVTLVFRPRGAM